MPPDRRISTAAARPAASSAHDAGGHAETASAAPSATDRASAAVCGQPGRGGSGGRRRCQDERLDHPRHALLGQRRRDVAGDRLDLGRGGRHDRAVPDLGQHLDVVPLVADREDRPERDTEPARQPAHRATLRHARRDELDEMRVADRDLGPTGEQGTREWRDLGRERRLAGAHHLGDRMPDRRDQVVLEPRAGPHERGVFVGARIVRADDEPLEVVEMRVEPLGASPDDDLARDLGRQRGVHEQAARSLGARAGISRMSAPW